jgi:hypothetical protein
MDSNLRWEFLCGGCALIGCGLGVVGVGSGCWLVGCWFFLCVGVGWCFVCVIWVDSGILMDSGLRWEFLCGGCALVGCGLGGVGI